MVSQALQQTQGFSKPNLIQQNNPLTPEQDNFVSKDRMKNILTDAKSKWLDTNVVITRMLDRGMELEWFEESMKQQVPSGSTLSQTTPKQLFGRADIAREYTPWGDSFWEEKQNFVGSMIRNIPSSAWNVVADVGNMVTHPLQTVKSIGWLLAWTAANTAIAGISAITGEERDEVKAKMFWPDNKVNNWVKDTTGIDMEQNESMADAMASFIVNRYGSFSAIEKTIAEDPIAVLWDVVSFLEWWAWFAARLWMLDKVSHAAIISRLNKVNPYVQVLDLPARWLKAASKPLAKWLGNFSEFVMNKLTSLNKTERTFAVNNPNMVNAFVKWTKTVETLGSEIFTKLDNVLDDSKALWKEYTEIRKWAWVADVSKLIDDIKPSLESRDIIVANDWNIYFDELSKFNDAQQTAIRSAWDTVRAIQQEQIIDANTTLNMRQKFDDIINWEWKSLKKSAVDKDAESVIRWFREKLDSNAKTIPWLKELDAKFGEQITEINQMRRDWYNADWTIKDSAFSKIKNLTNDANVNRLKRLEDLVPWITDDLMWLKVWNAISKWTEAKMGQFAQQALLVWGWIWVFANPVVWIPLLLAWVALTPKNIITALQKFWQAKASMAKIITKIQKWTKLSSKEEWAVWAILKENQAEIKQLNSEWWFTSTKIAE